MREHETPVSKIVSVALKFLKKQTLILAFVVSFADRVAGSSRRHLSAGELIYAGQGQPKFYMINGMTHPRSIGAKF